MQDLRFALRQLIKSPGFTVVSILTLALGIGLNTSMFTLMNLLILNPLPYPDRDHLVRIYRTNPQSQTAGHAAPDYTDLAREMASFADTAAYRQWGATLAQQGRPPVNLNTMRVTASFFPVLGMKPELGRFFNPEEDRPGSHVIILSYATWQAQFGGDPAVIGTTVRIEGESTTIIGVMPAAFANVFLWGPGDAFTPMALSDTEKRDAENFAYSILARYHPDLTLDQLNARLQTLAERLGRDKPRAHSSDGLRAVTLQSTTRNPGTVAISWMLVGLAGFVLVIACANLANLLLARSVARAHEFAIRAALGASRSRLLRPLLAESVLLSLAGGLFGILIALWANDWISSQLSANGFVKFILTLDWRVLVFAILLSLITGIFFGLAPAWLVSRVRVSDTLKSGTRGNTGDRAQHRFRHGLIVAQFALALVLLAGASFFIRNLDRMLGADVGWDKHGVLQAIIKLPDAKYTTPDQIYSFYTRLEDRLGALPGVENVSVSWSLPIFTFLTTRSFVAEGKDAPKPGQEPTAYVNGITPGYLDTLRVRLLAGRNFIEADNPKSTPVAIISESMAKALFPNESAIGHRIGGLDAANRGWLEIVGVMPDVRFAAGVVPMTTQFAVYRPLAQETWSYVMVALRGRAVETLAEPTRQAINALDADLAVQQLDTVDGRVKLATGSYTMINKILLSFALLGLFLASIGLYGVIANLVVQRTPEIGVRLALGAQTRQVIWLILRSGLKLTLWGTGLGLVGAIGLGELLARVMPNPGGLPLPKTSNLPPILAVTVLLLAVGLLACWLPSRRATKIDPIAALRSE